MMFSAAWFGAWLTGTITTRDAGAAAVTDGSLLLLEAVSEIRTKWF